MINTMNQLLSHPEKERLMVAEQFEFGETDRKKNERENERLPPGSTQMKLFRMTTDQALERAFADGYSRPVILNFAHGYNCGGGFEHASGSQEEDLFRCTSLFLSLWPHRRADDGAGVLNRGQWIGLYDHQLPRLQAFYPHGKCDAIYSPEVLMVSQAEPSKFPYAMGKNYYFAAISSAAQDVAREPPFDANLLREKIKTIFHIAALNNHDCLVLGAYGCGYFRNPPEEVARIFKQELDSGDFRDTFKAVYFGVVGDTSVRAFEAWFGAPQ